MLIAVHRHMVYTSIDRGPVLLVACLCMSARSQTGQPHCVYVYQTNKTRLWENRCGWSEMQRGTNCLHHMRPLMIPPSGVSTICGSLSVFNGSLLQWWNLRLRANSWHNSYKFLVPGTRLYHLRWWGKRENSICGVAGTKLWWRIIGSFVAPAGIHYLLPPLIHTTCLTQSIKVPQAKI